MRRWFSVLMMIALLLASNITSFAYTEDDHVHEWSDWEIEEESTCAEHGYEYRYCYICEDDESRKLPLQAHEWDSWETIRKATPYKKGVKARFCLICDKEQRKVIPKKALTSNQKKAINVVNTYLKAAKAYNVNKMNNCFKKGSKKYGYPTKEINGVFKKYNKKIKWTMVDVTGKGNTIKVKVKVTRPDFYKQAYNAFYETTEWYVFNPNASDSKLPNKLFGKYRTKVKNCTKKTSTDTVVFTIVKSGKKWKIKAQTKTLVDIATAFYWKGSEDASHDIVKDYS